MQSPGAMNNLGTWVKPNYKLKSKNNALKNIRIKGKEYRLNFGKN